MTCTSGTAAANFAPAVIEAHEAGLPLIVLTADRPPELREVGAGQTIDQLKLYGDAVKWFFEVGVHDAAPERVRWMRALACRAYWTALGDRPGPVHLNFPLREPLVVESLPEDPCPDAPLGSRRGAALAGGGRGNARDAPGLARAWSDRRRPSGAQSRPRALPLCPQTGYPLLADPLSGARRGPATIARYDVLLRDEHFTTTVRPELVLRVGDLPTSKPLRVWLAALKGVEQLFFGGPSAWQDPDAVVTAIADESAATFSALRSSTPRTRTGWRAGGRRTTPRAR